MISVVFNLVATIFAAAAYSAAPSSSVARTLDNLGSPIEALTFWVAPGHTRFQPILDLLISVTLCWAVIWIGLSFPAWWTNR
jgi:hypothetical protein